MAFILAGLLFLLSSLEAKDFGTYGHVFQIEEEDLLVWLQNKSKTLSKEEGEVVQEKIRDHYVSVIQKPHAVTLSQAARYRVTYLDPTIFADRDILDHEGNFVVKKGTCFNPCVTLTHLDALLFFDAENLEHLKWAKLQKGLVKWILTHGKPLELEDQENRPVYFDQFGILVEKFGITHLPAKVSKEGSRLKIEEIPMEKLTCLD